MNLLRACTGKGDTAQLVRKLLAETPGLSPNTHNSVSVQAVRLSHIGVVAITHWYAYITCCSVLCCSCISQLAHMPSFGAVTACLVLRHVARTDDSSGPHQCPLSPV